MLMVHVVSSNKWIFDTRATYHFCSFKELFMDFCESRMVMIKSDQASHKMKVGIIWVKVFNEVIKKFL